MKRIFSLFLCTFILLADFYAFPAYASVQDEADAQAKAFSGIWEQSGKKASDFEHTVLFETTGFQGDEAGGGGAISATGKTLSEGMIAVDPSVIPLGTQVMICGHIFTAEDTGGAIKGHIIDIWFPSIAICNNWGRQKVYVSWNGGSEPSPASGTPATVDSLEGDKSQFKFGNATGTVDTVDTKKPDKSLTATLKRIINSFKGTEDEIDGLDSKVNWGGSDVELPDGKDLTHEERLAIANWGTGIANSEDVMFVNLFRAIMASAGLYFILYTLFMYLAYWLDKVNNFVELNFLGILTFGKLTVSYDETVSTFNSDNKGVRLVCHRDMIKIVIIGIMAGVLILSGHVYSLISDFVAIVQRVTGGV